MRSLALLICLVALAAACGGSTNSNSSGSASTPAAGSTPAPAASTPAACTAVNATIAISGAITANQCKDVYLRCSTDGSIARASSPVTIGTDQYQLTLQVNPYSQPGQFPTTGGTTYVNLDVLVNGSPSKHFTSTGGTLTVTSLAASTGGGSVDADLKQQGGADAIHVKGSWKCS